MAGETGESIYNMFVQTSDSTNTLPVSWHTVTNWEYTTPHAEVDATVKRTESGIHPRLYFKYLKSKLSVIESSKFQARMKKLEQMAKEFDEVGQEAMGEECIKQFIVLTREAAVYACGFTKFLLQDHIDKYRYKVKGEAPVMLTPLKNFTRVLPANVVKKMKMCIEKKLFDEYIVAHLDQKGDKKLTEKERIEKERDPILFGKLQYSNRFYFIIDWEDDQDDLRLSDIVTALSIPKGDMTLSRNPEWKKNDSK